MQHLSLRKSVENELSHHLKHYVVSNYTAHGGEITNACWETNIHINGGGQVNCEVKINFIGQHALCPHYGGAEGVIQRWWNDNWHTQLDKHIFWTMDHFKLKMIHDEQEKKPRGHVSIAFSFFQKDSPGAWSPVDMFQKIPTQKILLEKQIQEMLYKFVRKSIAQIREILPGNGPDTAHGLVVEQKDDAQDVCMYSALASSKEFLHDHQRLIRDRIMGIIAPLNAEIALYPNGGRLRWHISQRVQQGADVAIFHFVFWYEQGEPK